MDVTTGPDGKGVASAAQKHDLDDRETSDPQASPPPKTKSRKGKKEDAESSKKRRCISSVCFSGHTLLGLTCIVVLTNS